MHEDVHSVGILTSPSNMTSRSSPSIKADDSTIDCQSYTSINDDTGKNVFDWSSVAKTLEKGLAMELEVSRARRNIRCLNKSLQRLKGMYSQSGSVPNDVSDDVPAIIQKLEQLSNCLTVVMDTDSLASQLSFTFRKSYCEHVSSIVQDMNTIVKDVIECCTSKDSDNTSVLCIVLGTLDLFEYLQCMEAISVAQGMSPREFKATQSQGISSTAGTFMEYIESVKKSCVTIDHQSTSQVLPAAYGHVLASAYAMYDQVNASSDGYNDASTTCELENECTSMPSACGTVSNEQVHPSFANVVKDDVMTVSVDSKTNLVSDSFDSLLLNADIKDFIEPCLTADCISEESASYSSNKTTDSFLLYSPLADGQVPFDPGGAGYDSSCIQSDITSSHTMEPTSKDAVNQLLKDCHDTTTFDDTSSVYSDHSNRIASTMNQWCDANLDSLPRNEAQDVLVESTDDVKSKYTVGASMNSADLTFNPPLVNEFAVSDGTVDVTTTTDGLFEGASTWTAPNCMVSSSSSTFQVRPSVNPTTKNTMPSSDRFTKSDVETHFSLAGDCTDDLYSLASISLTTSTESVATSETTTLDDSFETPCGSRFCDELDQALPRTRDDAKLLPHDRGPLLEASLGILFVHAVNVEDIFEIFDGSNVYTVLDRRFTFARVDDHLLFRDVDPSLFDTRLDNILEIPIFLLPIQHQGLPVQNTTYTDDPMQEIASLVSKKLYNDIDINVLMTDGTFTYSYFVDVTTDDSFVVPDGANVPASSGGLFEGTNAWPVSGSAISPSYSFEATEEDSFETCGVHVPASHESIGGVEFSNDNTALTIAMHPLISITDLTGLPPLLYAFQRDFAEALFGSYDTNASLGSTTAPMTSTVLPTHLHMITSLSYSICTAFSDVISYKSMSLGLHRSLNLQGLPNSAAVKRQVDVFVRRLVHARVNVEVLPHDRGPYLIVVGVVNC